MGARSEIRWGNRKLKACLARYQSRQPIYVVMCSDYIPTQFIRDIAQKLIRSALKHLKPLLEEPRHEDMIWQIYLVLGGGRTKVKGYPGGGLMVFAGDKKLLVDWQEDEVAILLASAIVDILSRSDAKKYLQAKVVMNEFNFIPQKLKHYLAKLKAFTWEREHIFEKDQKIMLVMAGAGYDPQSVADWYGKVKRPSLFYKFFQPSYQSRARRLHGCSTKVKAMISEIELSPDHVAGPEWYPGGIIDDLHPSDIESYRSFIKSTRY